ncbi:hypothetical protein EBR78_10760 [bacterium]|nr:hypothetical protein [bacterium]
MLLEGILKDSKMKDRMITKAKTLQVKVLNRSWVPEASWFVFLFFVVSVIENKNPVTISVT